MFEKLEQLRAKPHHIKKRIAFWTSAGITAVIFVFWVTSLRVTLDNQAVASLDGDVYVNQSGDLTDASGQAAGQAKPTPSPVAALTASVSNAFAPVGDLIKGFVSDFSSDATPPATSSAVEIYAADPTPTPTSNLAH